MPLQTGFPNWASQTMWTGDILTLSLDLSAMRRRPVRAKVRSTTRRRGNRKALRVPRLLHHLDQVFREARLPEPRLQLRPGTTAVRESPRQGRACFSAASIASGAPPRSCKPAGCTFMAVGEPSTSATARRLRPLVFLPPSQPDGPPLSAVFTDRLSITPAVGSGFLPAPFLAPPGDDSASASARRRAASRETGAGRSNGAGIQTEAPAVGAP